MVSTGSTTRSRSNPTRSAPSSAALWWSTTTTAQGSAPARPGVLHPSRRIAAAPVGGVLQRRRRAVDKYGGNPSCRRFGRLPRPEGGAAARRSLEHGGDAGRPPRVPRVVRPAALGVMRRVPCRSRRTAGRRRGGCMGVPRPRAHRRRPRVAGDQPRRRRPARAQCHRGGAGVVRLAARSPPTHRSRLDHGPDFYAFQSFWGAGAVHPVGMAWLNSWAYANDVPSAGWRGLLSVPRRLTITPDGVVRSAGRPYGPLRPWRAARSGSPPRPTSTSWWPVPRERCTPESSTAWRSSSDRHARLGLRGTVRGTRGGRSSAPRGGRPWLGGGVRRRGSGGVVGAGVRRPHVAGQQPKSLTKVPFEPLPWKWQTSITHDKRRFKHGGRHRHRSGEQAGRARQARRGRERRRGHLVRGHVHRQRRRGAAAHPREARRARPARIGHHPRRRTSHRA